MIDNLMNQKKEMNIISEIASGDPKNINMLMTLLKEISTHDENRDTEITKQVLTQIRDIIDPMILTCGSNMNNDQQISSAVCQDIGSDDIYKTITSEHNKKIQPTNAFIKFFIKDVIENVKKNNNERTPKNINVDELTTSLLQGLPETMEIDLFYNYVAEFLIAKSSMHYYYDVMAAYVAMKRLHNITSDSFLITAKLLRNNIDTNGAKMSLLSDEVYNEILKNHQRLQSEIDYSRDFTFDYFGIKTLERSYLYKLHQTQFKTIERPQHLWMRVSIGIHGNDIDSAIETYHLLSQKYFTHATPTLFNAGSRRPQMSSCFLQSVDDNIGSIFETVKEIAFTSKWAGGIGVHISSLRARGSLIRGTNGLSYGIVPFCILLNKLAKYINQGGKRNGSIACFCENTEVFTTNDGVKKIQDVKIGDLVVTHENRIKPVVQVHKNPLGDRKIYKLEVEKNKIIYVTGNHRFWSCYTKKYKSKKKSLGWNSVEDLKGIMDDKKTTRQACYISIPAGTNIENTNDYKINIMDYKEIILEKTGGKLELTEFDRVHTMSEPTDKNGHVKKIKSQSVKKIWHITQDLANLFGMWLGDGHIRKSRTGGKILGIVFTVHKDNIKEIEFIHKICEETFGSRVTYYTSKNRNVTQISINSHLIGVIFMELFGSYFNGKKLPQMVFSWPKNLINSLVAGLITTDGHIAKTKFNATLGLSNENLMNQLYHLCRNNGIDVSIVKYAKTKGLSCDPYSMSIPLTKEILNQTYKYYTDGRIEKCLEKLNENEDKEKDLFLKILNITETDRNDEYVYTLGVEDDHSYTVEGLVAENCYIEPWHADIFDFCDLRKNTGNDDNRARDLFLALWVPSLFIKRVKEDGVWSLMCPDMCPGLNLTHSKEFNILYEKYESEKKYIKQVRARDLWKHILETQSETGFPYILYKDHANAKSNQKNLGTIRSSNLCAEIIQYSDENESAVCNLASICLPKYISTHRGAKIFDHKKLIQVVRVIVRNLDKIIDRNYYPTIKTKRSNFRHRPMGIGVQGLADVFNIMGFSFDSQKAYRLNKEIFETIYFACIDESKELAKKYGTYQSFKGSPASMGQLQFHMWGLQNDDLLMKYDWNKLVQEVKTHGLRNSLLTALMPTASTSQIMGNSECIEPYMKNIFKRSTLAGDFIVVNKNLMKELIDLKLWNDDMRKRLIIEDGSVQNIDSIPDHVKEVYKTAFEIQQMHLVRQSADRGCFVDQSQSFNLFLKEPNFDILTSALIESHDLGNKTGMYYYRSSPAVNPISFGIDVNDIQRLTGKTNVIDMIQDSYDIESEHTVDKEKEQKTYIVKKKIQTDSYPEPNNSNNEVKMCKWKPGMKLEDCLECGS